MDSISAATNNQLYSLLAISASGGQSAGSSAGAGSSSADGLGPAVIFEASSLQLQAQLTTTLLASLNPVGQNVNALA